MLKVLASLGVENRPRLHVLNKFDLLSPEDQAALREIHPHNGQNIFTSASTGFGLDRLLERIDAVLPVDPLVHLHLRLPVSDGRRLSLVYAAGRVFKSEIRDDHMILDAEVPQSLARQLEGFALEIVAAPSPASEFKS